MATQQWRPVGRIAPAALGQARLQAHNAVQWVARLAHSYLKPASGDRHLDLTRANHDGALVGHDCGNGLSVGLDVASLTLQFREHGQRSAHPLALEGRSPAEVEAWFLVELLHRNVDCDRFSKVLPFEIEGLMAGDNVDFKQESLAGQLAEIAIWQANAAIVLDCVAIGVGPVICSPRHFDLAVVLPIKEQPSAAVRAGFAAGDQHVAEPYFYVVAAAVLERAAIAEMPGIAGARNDGLAARILPATDVLASADGPTLALDFLRSGVADCRRRLAH